MATIALSAVGATIGSVILPGIGTYIGASIGAMAGSYIDQNYLFPAIFGKPKSEGPRLDDRQVQAASEGSPVNYCLGRENRVAGTIIWATDFQEEEVEEEQGKNGESVTYRYYISLAIGIAEGPISRVRKIWANGKLMYNADGDVPATNQRLVKSIHVHTGSYTQGVDSVISGAVGANTPAYRGTAYVVFERLLLEPFGNQVPQFSILVEGQAALSVGQAIGKLVQRAGLPASRYDVTAVPGCLRGYTIAGPQTPASNLKPLLIAYNLGVREEGGKFYFFPKGEERVFAADAGDLGAAAAGDEPAASFRITDPSGLDLPSEVTVAFLDRSINYQRGAVVQRMRNPATGNAQTLELPLPLASSEGKVIAKRALWTPWLERQVAAFTLPPSYLKLCEGDVVRVSVGGVSYRVRAVRVERGANCLLSVEGVIERATDLADITANDDDIILPPEPSIDPLLLQAVVADIPPLRDQDAAVPGVYWGLARAAAADPWYGGALYQSRDGQSYLQGGQTQIESQIGTTASALAAGPMGYWDRINTVEVTLFRGQLVSRSESDVFNGLNWMLVGREIIAYRDAELIAANTYRLSTLLRGLRDTGRWMGGHSAGERIAALSATGLAGYLPLALGDIGTTQHFKGVAVGSAVEDAPDTLLGFVGNALRPFAPTHLRARRDGSGNLTLSWLRRTRAIVRVLGMAVTPLLEASERYEVEILSGTTVLRSFAVGDAAAVSYSAAQQSSDGLTPFAPLHVRVYQLSNTIGRGNAAEAIL